MRIYEKEEEQKTYADKLVELIFKERTVLYGHILSMRNLIREKNDLLVKYEQTGKELLFMNILDLNEKIEEHHRMITDWIMLDIEVGVNNDV